MGGFSYLKNVVTLDMDSSKCTGCGLCSIVCPHGVFKIKGKNAMIADRDACMECGACARNCPEGAIDVNAGVGCATAFIIGALRGTEPTCDCSGESTCCE
jgi:NAD-dependent dihydropyrimidine dehydrogenase PreA subunit